jgi:23S rRNA pseudouridine2605 synthase
MKPKKDNSGGKKFQNRMPDEKRVKVSSKRPDKPESTFKFGDKPFRKKPFGSDRADGGDKPFEKKRFADDRPTSYGDKKRTSTSDRPFKKRTDEGATPYGDKKPFGKKTYGDKPFSDRPRSGFKKSGTDNGDKPFGKKPYDKKGSAGTGRPYSGAKNFKDKKAGFEDSNKDATNFRTGYKRDGVDKKPFKDKKETDGRYNKNQEFNPKPSNYKGRNKTYSRTSEDLLKGKKLVEDEVRLNRYIANSGLCSRREADVMIEQGLVTLNGQVVLILGTKVNPGDDVRVDGKRINPEKPVYILLNKPKGFITSTSDPNERATVMDLIDLPGKERIYPVGRLDRNTTGVLLLTNDGELAQKLMHPSFEIKKIYRAKLDSKPSKDHLLGWVNGVELEDGYMNFEQVGFVDEEDDTVLGLEVHSGRNRIVRRMFEHYGYEVLGLDRVMLGEFDHLKLGRGKWRFLNEKEIRYVEQLKRMKGKKPKY